MVFKVNAYQTEQLETLERVDRHLRAASDAEKRDLLTSIAPYLDFRRETARFLEARFSDVCTRNCYRSRLSACCSKDGIITFFGDVVVNRLIAAPKTIAAMIQALRTPNDGYKCVYLGDDGCLWRLKPVVCEMFLCDAAQKTVFGADPEAKRIWRHLREQKQRFTWPDRPVLFDRLEARFMAAGLRSPLMYLHNSPGLLRVKQRSMKQGKTQ